METKVSPELSVVIASRDPKKIHDPEFFKVAWVDIFAEPDPGVHSLNPIWAASRAVFRVTRLWTYRILSIFGVISACCFGCEYGCTACYTIWCCTPQLTLCKLVCLPIKTMYAIYLDTCARPWVNVISYIFWNIRVKLIKTDSNDHETV